MFYFSRKKADCPLRLIVFWRNSQVEGLSAVGKEPPPPYDGSSSGIEIKEQGSITQGATPESGGTTNNLNWCWGTARRTHSEKAQADKYCRSPG